MPRKTNASTPLAPDATSGTLALLRAVAGEEMFAAAVPILRDQMGLTPEKLALIIHRILNPDHIPGETQEAALRGMSPTTLRTMKQAKELPVVVNGKY